jgi:hypothetical protein
MKIIHGSLSGLLGEVTAHGPDDGVRVAALMQSTVEGAGMPRYTSWVIVSGRVAGEQWAEWRWWDGSARITEPASASREAGPRGGRLAEVRGGRAAGWECATASSPRRRDARGSGLVRARPASASADSDLRRRRTSTSMSSAASG